MFRRQRGRSSSAKVYRIQSTAGHGPGCVVHLLKKRGQIFLHPLLPALDREGGKGTVETRSRAERDSHIQAVAVLIIDGGEKFPLTLSDLDA